MPCSRSIALRVSIAASVLALGILLWPTIGEGFSSAFQACARHTLGELEFGSGGHARFLARADEPAGGHGEGWDAAVALRVDGMRTEHVIRINPRRLLYLPLVLLWSVVFSAPLRLGRKLLIAALGAASLLGVAFISVWITISWIFDRVPGLVYPASPLVSSLRHLAYEGFVTPIASKFALPVLLGIVLCHLLRIDGVSTQARSGNVPQRRTERR